MELNSTIHFLGREGGKEYCYDFVIGSYGIGGLGKRARQMRSGTGL